MRPATPSLVYSVRSTCFRLPISTALRRNMSGAWHDLHRRKQHPLCDEHFQQRRHFRPCTPVCMGRRSAKIATRKVTEDPAPQSSCVYTEGSFLCCILYPGPFPLSDSAKSR